MMNVTAPEGRPGGDSMTFHYILKELSKLQFVITCDNRCSTIPPSHSKNREKDYEQVIERDREHHHSCDKVDNPPVP